MKYAKTPWSLVQVPMIKGAYMIVDANGTSVPYGLDENPHRIVACVNACEGINPEAVPDLLKALFACAEMINGKFTKTIRGDIPEWYDLLTAAQDAIAKATNA